MNRSIRANCASHPGKNLGVTGIRTDLPRQLSVVRVTTATPPEGAEGDAKKTPPQATDDLVTTHHTLRVGRRTLRYTATSGRVVLRQEVTKDGTFEGHQPKAEVFLTAYTLDRETGVKAWTPRVPPRRPLRRGLPRRRALRASDVRPGQTRDVLLQRRPRVVVGVAAPGAARPAARGDGRRGDSPPPPYDLADNPQSLLAHTDLVFIDPVSTGSRARSRAARPATSTGTEAISSRSARSSGCGPPATAGG